MTEVKLALSNTDEANIASLLARVNQPEVRKEVNALGSSIIDKNRREWALSKVKVRDIITGSKGAELIGKKLVQLRVQSNKIDKLTEVNRVKKWFINESKIIAKSVVKFEEIEKTIEIISEDMRSAVTMLEQDSRELAEASNWIKEQKDEIGKITSLLKQMLDHLEKDEDIPLENVEKMRLKELLATRRQDLKIISGAYDQFLATISQTIFNNSREAQTADRLETVVSIVGGVGFIIRAAMNRQREVSELNEGAKQFVASMLEQNADALVAQTEASKQSYGDMTSIMDALKDAYGKISSALETEAEQSQELAEEALKNVAELDNLQATLDRELEARKKANDQLSLVEETKKESIQEEA
jgi:hypothetical protein